VQWNEPDGLRKPTAEELSKNYDDLDKYGAVRWNEPDGLCKLTPEELSKNYDDLDKYGAIRWNEPDGLRKLTPEELSKNYDDLEKYGAVRWNEPDGLRKLTPEELSKNYDDLDKYGPVTWNEPDGLRRLTPEEESKQYTDLGAYKQGYVADEAVLQAHEETQQDPTQKAEPIPAKVEVPSEDPTKLCDDLDEYGPVRWNEPDGLRRLTPEELSKNYDDLDKYGAIRWNEPDGLRRLTPEELSKKYKDLPRYRQYDNSGPATPRVHPEEASKQYEDLRKYDSFPNAGPTTERIHPELASRQYKDLSKYPVAGFEEPEKTRHIHPEELTKNYGDLDKYKPRRFDSPSRAYPMHPEEATKFYKDLTQYKPVMHNEPDGKRAATPDPASKGPEGYDARVKDSSQQSSGEDAGLSSMDESFPSEEAKLEPSLHRRWERRLSRGATTHDVEKKQAEADAYSKAPQGLRTSYTEGCGGKATRPTLVKHHQSTTPREGDQRPASYKILAYDASTQSISVAETTSAVDETASPASPASPADVLLRLSNPSKFLPHFRALQAQGYEIASGSGDVLVFRKVRPGSPEAAWTAGVAPGKGSPINPIDMMGKPVTGNFASPTGFVNYDALAEGEGHKPSPPYTKATREEGYNDDGLRKGKKKWSFGRKVVVGTVWVAGTAYAAGVLGEHSATGGMEGSRPKRP
ncbi:Uncharacterized protein TCAP_06589, partial [Tolypocladium capitatum]